VTRATTRLDAARREELTEALDAERERARERLAAARRSFDEIVESSAISPPDDEHDPEGATIAFEREQLSALASQAQAHLEELEAARARLQRGDYGICESCGQAIPLERLLARPTARRCVGC
jgi:RNA polymerase-binding transcription factor